MGRPRKNPVDPAKEQPKDAPEKAPVKPKKTPAKKMNLYQKIIEVMRRVTYLQKDMDVRFGNTHYTAFSAQKILTVVRKELIEVGIVIIPMEVVSEITLRPGKEADVLTASNISYKIVNADDPEDFDIGVSVGHGTDSQDKSAGMAATYALKYFIRDLLLLPVGDDPDAVASKEKDAADAHVNTVPPQKTKPATKIEEPVQAPVNDQPPPDPVEFSDNPFKKCVDIANKNPKHPLTPKIIKLALDNRENKPVLEAIVHLMPEVYKGTEGAIDAIYAQVKKAGGKA